MAGPVLLSDGSYYDTQAANGAVLAVGGAYYLDSATLAVQPRGAALGAGSGGLELSVVLPVLTLVGGSGGGLGGGYAVLSVVPPGGLRINLTVNL